MLKHITSDIVYNFTDDKLSVGLLTTQKLVKLHNEGDLCNQVQIFYEAIRGFFTPQLQAMHLKTSPFLMKFFVMLSLLISTRLNSTFTQVLYFVSRCI